MDDCIQNQSTCPTSSGFEGGSCCWQNVGGTWVHISGTCPPGYRCKDPNGEANAAERVATTFEGEFVRCPCVPE